MEAFCFWQTQTLSLSVLSLSSTTPVHGVEPWFSTMNHLAAGEGAKCFEPTI